MKGFDFRNIAEQNQDEIIALARHLVQFDTSNTGSMPTGNETTAANFLLKVLSDEGIEGKIYGRVPERGNLCASMRGRVDEKALLFVSHMDVVPTGDKNQWIHPPFEAVVQDGLLHGRGAADMKGTVAAEAMALILLRRLGIQFASNVGLVCVADEEAGGHYGMRWLAQEHSDQLRAGCCINEGGGTFVRVDGRDWCLLGIGEKGRWELNAVFHGRGAHAAWPWKGDNALYKATAALQQLRRYEPERNVSLPLFDHLRQIVGPVTEGNVDQIIETLAKVSPDLADHVRQISRMVVTPTLISGGLKSNSVPESCRVTCDVRTLPGQDRSYIADQLESFLPEAEIAVDQTAVSISSPISASLVAILSDSLLKMLGRPTKVVPTIGGGFTDSRFIRELGVAAYGFSPNHPDSNPALQNVHGSNESVAIRDIVLQTALYMELAYQLAAA